MFDEAAGEVTIGGIYLRLFIQQPAWVGSLKQKKRLLINLCFRIVSVKRHKGFLRVKLN